jgi:hypothetical protein
MLDRSAVAPKWKQVMNPKDDDKEKATEDGLRKAVEDLKKKDAEEDRGDMPVDASLGRSGMEAGGEEERLPLDDEEN